MDKHPKPSTIVPPEIPPILEVDELPDYYERVIGTKGKPQAPKKGAYSGKQPLVDLNGGAFLG
jgi:hypothetical protein